MPGKYLVLIAAFLIISLGLGGTGPALAGEPDPGADEFVNSLGMRFRLIPAGSFQMGSPEDSGWGHERPRHRVRLTRPFYLGVHEVSQRQWSEIMDYNPGFFKNPDHPVEQVDWKEIKVFIQLLQIRENDMGYRLPHEAEWEYACRAGTRAAWSFGQGPEDLSRFAWHFANSNRRTHPIGTRAPNRWGLHDMHGNVWEWCEDAYAPDYYGRSPLEDPAGPLENTDFRVLRGGSWYSGPDRTRSAARFRHTPGHYANDVGFRLVLEP